jgi:putative DNA methylase
VTEKKKLIEVSIPLDAINKEAAREKSIRHGHPSTLHLWWARRPLAACRAVLFAQLVDDPSARPDEFTTEEDQARERKRLHNIIERLVKWENSNNEDVLEEARAEIRRSCAGEPPPLLDPFCGGGSIPLEAQRLGLEVHASDLNPVAVLITKALVEVPPRWADRPPVHPGDDLGNKTWRSAQGLAEDVRYYGGWMCDEAKRRIGHLYPKASLPDGPGTNVIAWIWARTVTCPNPACRATMPLAGSFWLGKRKGKESWVRPVIEGKHVRFEIGHGKSGPPDPPKLSRGAKFRCVACGEAAPEDHIKAEGMAGRMGAQLMAVVAEGDRRRVYLPPSHEQERAADVARPDDVPETELVDDSRAIWCRLYGLLTHADLFTSRQLVALTTFSDLVLEARARAEVDANAADLTPDDASTYADAIATYLACALSKLADRHSTLTNWYVSRESTSSTFQRQAIPMLWDFAETNPLLDGTGTYFNAVEWTAEVLQSLGAGVAGLATEGDAAQIPLDRAVVVATDPPYYDNIGYADLADYFYVWLRRSLRRVYPELFRTVLTPKSTELVATPYRFEGSRERAKRFFEQGFVRAFSNVRKVQPLDVPVTLFYAFKQAENDGQEGVVSTGWETMLEALLQAGLSVTATWPMRTEASNRMIASGTNSLASSIALACRPRAETAGVTDRRGFLSALKAELPSELAVLRQANIAPVDLAQAAIGPGMAVFSRYARVIEPSGEPMRVRTSLGLINHVLAEVLDEQEGDFDPETRWAIKWFEQHGLDNGSSGEADQLCRTYGTALNALEDAGIAMARKGKTRLLERSKLPDDWDPAADDRTPIWEATQHMVKRLQEHSENAAADLLRRLGGLGDTVQLLAYRLHSISDRRGWSAEAIAYNSLGASWSEIQRLANADRAAVSEQGQMV